MKELGILARNIKRYRLVKGLTQEDLAKKVTLAKDTMSMIELGKQENVGLKYLILICRELDVELEQLFMEDSEGRFIKLVISDKNFEALKKIVDEFKKL